jgi:hypothetical protein
MISVPHWPDVFDGYDNPLDRAILIGYGLNYSFIWNDYKPDYNYWRDVYYNLQNLTLDGWTRTGSSPSLAWITIFTDACAHAPEEKAQVLSSALYYAFLWGNTKEGFDYWKEVHLKLRSIETLTEEDAATIEVEEKIWWDKGLPKRIDVI